MLIARYSYALGTDQSLAMLRSGGNTFYNTDAVGTVTSLTNAAGSLVQSYSFDAFGKATATNGSVVNPFQFTAREFDSETNLEFMRARYYDVSSGRFLNEDPVGFIGGINLYEYAGNDPANYIDPTGLSPTSTLTLPSAAEVDAFLARLEQQLANEAAAGVEALEAVGSGVAKGVNVLGIVLTPTATAGPQDDDTRYVPNASSDTQRQREYEIMKRFCDSPVAGSNPCSTLSKQIDHAEKCIELYEAWDAKYEKDRHADKIASWKKRLKNLKEEYSRDCTQKCK